METAELGKTSQIWLIRLVCVFVFAQVQTAESEAKIVAQYSELVKEAKLQFEREVSSLHPEIQANWKGLSKKHIHTVDTRTHTVK